ncbi:MAG: tRNA lysidine(34) synthetase TilS, partial [Pseudomonadota bacterium]
MLLLAHEALPGEIAVASINHGLRSEAADEVALVERLCEERDIPFLPISVKVAAGNLQAKAREARYNALVKWVDASGLGALATAHHANDQAETLLMRLARGSGLSGLAGVRAASELGEGATPLLRPLLDWTKSDLEQIVADANIAPVRDPSNADSTFDRVRVREHLAKNPWLDAEALSLSAEYLAEAWRAIEWYAQIDWEEMVHRDDTHQFRYFVNVPRIVA